MEHSKCRSKNGNVTDSNRDIEFWRKVKYFRYVMELDEDVLEREKVLYTFGLGEIK